MEIMACQLGPFLDTPMYADFLLLSFLRSIFFLLLMMISASSRILVFKVFNNWEIYKTMSLELWKSLPSSRCSFHRCSTACCSSASRRLTATGFWGWDCHKSSTFQATIACHKGRRYSSWVPRLAGIELDEVSEIYAYLQIHWFQTYFGTEP